MAQTEAWQRGPLPEVPTPLMPAAHALVQAREEIERAMAGLSIDQVSRSIGDAATIAFHLRHVAGAIDRLLTYARGEKLEPAQLAAARAEPGPASDGDTPRSLLDAALAGIDRALDAVRVVDPATLNDARTVGRLELPTTVLGLLGHIAEHTTRHAGQIVTTSRIVRGLDAVGGTPGGAASDSGATRAPSPHADR